MQSPAIRNFKGINNVSDPIRLGLSWLVQADNVNITDSGALVKRDGYSLVSSGNYASAFSTFDYSRMYVSVGGDIKNFAGTPLVTLQSTAPLYWTEINNQVFFNNGTDAGIINPDDAVLPWRWDVPPQPVLTVVTGSLAAGTYQVLVTQTLADGRETGASDTASIELTEGQALQISGLSDANVYIAPANSTVFQYAGTYTGAFTFNSTQDNLGRDFLNDLLDPLPTCDLITAWAGRIYAATFMPTENQTVIWFSEPLGFHLFNLSANFILIPGHVLMMAHHDGALIIGTDAEIYAYDGQKLGQLADYGVVAGQHWVKDSGRTLFWAKRGLCAALPFANLTETMVSVPPGIRAAGCVIRADGQKRFVACIQQGGEAFNAHS